MTIAYIERYKNVFGVEPICTTLTSADVTIAPSAFHAVRTPPPSAMRHELARHRRLAGAAGSGGH